MSMCSYRMVPDVRFPVQYEDCLEAARHFLQRDVLAHYSVDPERVAVCGDSAGGNLAAAVAQQVNLSTSPTHYNIGNSMRRRCSVKQCSGDFLILL